MALLGLLHPEDEGSNDLSKRRPFGTASYPV